MGNWVDVISSLLLGATNETDAAVRLGVPAAEVKRLRKAAAGDITALMPIAVNLARRRVELLDLAGASYREPFFQETIEACRSTQPARLNLEVDLDSLIEAARRSPAPPDGFIFHTGRCGSTLLANMLTASGEHLLVKEPGIINELIAHWLAAEEGPERCQRAELVAAVIRCLSTTPGTARYRMLKFSAWNICMAETLLHLFPRTPAVFVYRRPTETVASMLHQPPEWFELIDCPRPLQARFFPTVQEEPEERRLRPAVLFAHAWRSATEAALALPPGHTILLDYKEMIASPAEAMTRVVTHFGEAWKPEQISAMVSARPLYAKDPTGTAVFDPAGAHRRPPLAEADGALVRSITGQVWGRLKERRNT
jgi:Sulfotransferase family